MVKILLLGDCHDSPYIPQVVLSSLDLLRDGNVNTVIIAEGVVSNLRDRIDNLKNIEIFYALLKTLEKNHLKLYKETVGVDKEFQFYSKENIAALRDFFKTEEVLKIFAKIDSEDLKEVMASKEHDFVEIFAKEIHFLKYEIENNFGIPRIQSYRIFCEEIFKRGIKYVELEKDLNALTTTPRYNKLMDKFSEKTITEEEWLELNLMEDRIVKDDSIDKERTVMMLDSIQREVLELQKNGEDAVIIVYPIGVAHVAPLLEALQLLSMKDSSLFVEAHSFFDDEDKYKELRDEELRDMDLKDRESRDRKLKYQQFKEDNPSSKRYSSGFSSDEDEYEDSSHLRHSSVFSSLKNVCFLSKQEDKAKYFAELEKFIGIKSPDAFPKLFGAASLSTSDKTPTL